MPPLQLKATGELGSTAKQMLCTFKALRFQGSQALCARYCLQVPDRQFTLLSAQVGVM